MCEVRERGCHIENAARWSCHIQLDDPFSHSVITGKLDRCGVVSLKMMDMSVGGMGWPRVAEAQSREDS